MGGAGKVVTAICSLVYRLDQVGRPTLATNLIFEIAIPFGKQGGHDAPGWEFVSQWLVDDPLSYFELVKSHCRQ